MTGIPTSPWHGLLVSVRDTAEAAEAVAGDADIVDVKEPTHGPLGAADPAVSAAVAGVVRRRRPWTLACGELRDGIDVTITRLARTLALLPGRAVPPAAVKAGPAGLAIAEWSRLFVALVTALPPGVEPVAVAYADWDAAGAPDPDQLVPAAAAVGCTTLLIDTFDKAGPGLLDAPLEARAARCVARARALGMRVAVAGRIRADQICAATRLGADVVAVRSAACGGRRLGRVSAARVVEVAAALRAARPAQRPA